MSKLKTERDYDRISWILLVIATILILFSFLAPILFTTFTSKWNFTDKGQIGDTIGGIMNPFIGIAGVVSTFVAFLMQVQANKIQKQQFLASLDKGAIDEKIDSYIKLELLKNDIDGTIRDINSRVQRLDVFITQLRHNPYNYAKLLRTPLKRYDRIASLERLSIYKGFQNFLSWDSNWIETFYALYSALDYMSEAFNDMYEKTDYHNNDIYNDKMNIRDSLISLEKECAAYLINKAKHDGSGTEYSHYVETLFYAYQEIVRNEQECFVDIEKILTEFVDNVRSGMQIKNFDVELWNLCKQATDILMVFTTIKQKSKQFLPELDSFKENFNAPKLKLQEIANKLQEGLDKTSIAQIRQEYYRKTGI